MADYCTTTEVKALIPESGLQVVFDYDSMLAVLVTAASRAIDREVGQDANYFSPSSDNVTRYYDGNNKRCLQVGDWVSVATVAVSDEGGLASSDYTAWSSSDYITYPYNTTPITRLDVDTLNGSQLYFDAYPKSVRVTGIYGYSTTPPSDVALACKMQVIRWFMRTKQMLAETGGDSERGGYSFDHIDPDISSLLNPYKLRQMGHD